MPVVESNAVQSTGLSLLQLYVGYLEPGDLGLRVQQLEHRPHSALHYRYFHGSLGHSLRILIISVPAHETSYAFNLRA